MAQGRFLSVSIAYDVQLAKLSMVAEMMFLKAIPHLDRDGMITGDPMALLGIISPMRFSEVHSQMPGIVDQWVSVGLVMRFESGQAGMALFFKGFLKQQSLKYSRERPSQFVCPPGYLRTESGLKASTDVLWSVAEVISIANAGVLPKNPAKEPVLQESAAQQQQEQQQQQQQEHKQQQQQQETPVAPDLPAAAAEAKEVRQELEAFGITGKILNELSTCPIEHVQGWIEYAGTQERLRNPKGYVIARLRSGEPPPEVGPSEDSDDDSYEALRRKYVPDGWADIIEH